MISVEHLFLHPFKGLRPLEKLQIELRRNIGIPFDRCFAFAFEDALAAQNTPLDKLKWIGKSNLANQNDWPALAAICYEFNFATWDFSMRVHDQTLAAGNLGSESDRKLIAAAMHTHLMSQCPSSVAKHPNATPMNLIGDPNINTRYPDRANYAVSIVSLSSLEELKSEAQCDIDIRAFRGNIVIAGSKAWDEQNWIGSEMNIGSCRVKIAGPIVRCHNINVHPESGAVDSRVLAALAKLRRGKFGVAANVIVEGILHTKDLCTLCSSNSAEF